MSNAYLKELNLNMGMSEYLMYQDIPAVESGSHNLCNGISFNLFPNSLERELSRRFQIINLYDTPTRIYIMYINEYPIGYIGLRTELDINWKKWSGNFYYAIRKSERNKGYGNKILELGILKFKEWGYETLYGVSSIGNDASSKVILKNGGIFLYEDAGSKHYKIKLK